MGIASGQIIRVLLISAREGARDEVATVLEQRPHDYRLFWVAQPDLALGRVQDLVPNVVIIDDELGGTSSISLIGTLSVRAPTAALIALVSPGAISKANQAVLAGARGFLVKPLQSDELMATMRYVLTQPRSPVPTVASRDVKNGRVVAFCAPKGGTGRTTMAINVAYWLIHETKNSVAMIDADFSAPALDVAMNLHSDHSIIDLLPRIARLDNELVKGILEQHNSGMNVLLAPPPILMNQAISLPHVQQIVAQMQHMFDWVVVDSGLPLDETTFAFLDGADRIIMTVLPELVGLRNATLMLEQLRSRGYPEERIWVVINRSTLRGGITREDIEEHLHIHVKHVIPDDQPLATFAINRGVPFSMSHPSAAVSRANKSLAELLIRDAEKEKIAEGELPEKAVARKTQVAWPWAKRPREA
ncbi:MAG: AAA family ATPase [Anaerolineae bacterium]